MTLYTAQTNSPNTATAGAITASDTTITVENGSVFDGLNFPNLLTLGYTLPASETVLCTEISGNTLTVVRGVDGTALNWPSGTVIARVFTALDWNTMIEEKQTATELLQSAVTLAGDDVFPLYSTDLARSCKIRWDFIANALRGALFGRLNGIIKSAGGSLSAATPDVDYATPSSIPSASSSTPLMDGTASAGSSSAYSRADHTHPTDTTRAALGDLPQASDSTPLMDGVAGAGSSGEYSRSDHIHPTDTSRAANADVVHLTGAETVGGDKTFTGALSIQAPTGSNNPATKEYVDNAVSASPTGLITQSATLAFTDMGKVLFVNTSNGNITITLPSLASAAIYEVEFINIGTGTITFATTYAPLCSKGGAVTIANQYGAATAKAYNNSWYLVGDLS